MVEQSNNKSNISITKIFWTFYLMTGFQILGDSLFWINIVPLSNLFWPYENYHAIEMGAIITITSLITSFSGLYLGKLIDKYSRKKILFLVSIIIGFTRIFLSFAQEGQGIWSWGFFLIFLAIASFFAGGNWPAHVSVSKDSLKKDQRSQFFGILGFIYSIAMFFGLLFGSFAFQIGIWRAYLIIIGLLTIIFSFIFWKVFSEPKRGAQEDELIDVLKDSNIVYSFQIDKNMMRKTMLSPTNIAALIEGVFTCILLGGFYTLLLPYTQLSPHNISPFNMSIFLVIFGGIGSIIGQGLMAKLSDKYAAQKPIRRIKFIIASLIILFIILLIFFFLPLPLLFPQQGQDLAFLISFPIFWIMGLGIVVIFCVSGLYGINQGPILQNINLPEAQGQIISWNQFVEAFGNGLGPLISAIFLTLTVQNFQITAVLTLLFGIPGIIFWNLAIKYYPKDSQLIKDILKERADILKSKK